VVLVVLLFGAGTDYCLFLVSRFREYMADDIPGGESAQRAVGRVGETITSSAGTVIVGMVALSFADMKLFASTGPSLALGIAVGLLAGLTLTPALLAVMGRWAFWPGGARHARQGGLWSKLAHWVTSRPWVPLILAMVVLTPLTMYGQGMPRNFDLLADLPEEMPSKAGFNILSESMGAGEMQPLELVIIDIPDARSSEGLAHIDAITQDVLAVDGVADVRSLTLPAGRGGAEVADVLRVDGQLALMGEMIDELRGQSEDPSVLADMDLEETLAGFDTLRAYLTELGAAFPDLAGNANYQAAQDSLETLKRAIVDGQKRLLVSNQLAEAANAIVSGLEEQTLDLGSVEDLEEGLEGFLAMGGYLTGLAEAYPAIAEMDGYDDALAALDSIERTAFEIKEALRVSTQLGFLADGMSGMAAQMQDPVALAELSSSPEQAEGLAILDAYLQALVTAYPSLMEKPAFQSALERLVAVQISVEEVMQAQLVSNQLALVAQQMDAYAQALDENPLALLPQPGEPSAAEQMALLQAYLEDLGTAYPALAATEDYEKAMTLVVEMGAGLETIDLSQIGQLIGQTKESLEALSAAFAGMSAIAADTMPEAVYMPEGQVEGAMAFAPDLAPIMDEMAAASDDLAVVAEEVRSEMPGAIFVPEVSLGLSEALASTLVGVDLDLVVALEEGLDGMADALERMSAAAAAELPDATYIPPDDLMAGEAEAAIESLLTEVDAFGTALKILTKDFSQRGDGFFIPTALVEEEAGDDLDQLLDTYSTTDGQATRLQVVLEHDPFSREAMDAVAHLREEVSQASSGYVSGSTATNLDLQRVMDRDFVKVMLLVVGGILVVLVLLLRSLVAPIYMMLTILLSYGATMGITRLVFDGLLGEGIAWFVPFLIFVVLVALGMDYNIFLMGRVKEEVALLRARAGNGTRAGIERAVERTGGIITSAGIIMAGTFAAMMSSSLLGLVQLGFAVAVGMLLDTFVIRTTLVPAIATLLGKWNWWPGKGPGR
jgi:uncharacterized membrane protein YdfJ with MMPL/SSD domain